MTFQISAKEQAFWDWWEKVEKHEEFYTLRMAFDAGYDAGREDGIGGVQ